MLWKQRSQPICSSVVPQHQPRPCSSWSYVGCRSPITPWLQPPPRRGWLMFCLSMSRGLSLIDEIERLASEHIGVLNSLTAPGIISETKHGKTRSLSSIPGCLLPALRWGNYPRTSSPASPNFTLPHIQSRSLLRYHRGY